MAGGEMAMKAAGAGRNHGAGELPERMLIGGEWVSAAGGRTFDVTNPATDEVLARVPDGGVAETRQAIAAAHGAWPAWRGLAAQERSRAIRRLAVLMVRDQERLARIMTLEQGKPLIESRGEIAYAASFLEWSAEEAKRVYGETVPASSAEKRILVLKQPVGISGAITPWNFPAAMITRKLGPALAAGCVMIVKPAEATPLSALAIGALAIEAGLPAGVVNIVTGDAKAIGGEFFANDAVRKVTFTGSTEVGRILMKQAAERIVRLSLELGGHAPFIVFEDADIEAAVKGAVASKMRNMGQTCICANRFLVQEGVREEFTSRLKAAMEGLKIGNGLEEGVRVGPLIDDAAVEKVEAHVEDALSRGARLRTGGKRAAAGNGLAKRFFEPTVLEGVTGEMLVSREETFGPVAPVRGFRDEREAVEMAYDFSYVLAAYLYRRDA